MSSKREHVSKAVPPEGAISGGGGGGGAGAGSAEGMDEGVETGKEGTMKKEGIHPASIGGDQEKGIETKDSGRDKGKL